jgi:hypothetical protein
MEPKDRIVTRTPLQELWNEDGDLAATRIGELDRDAIRSLLGRGPVHFVIADVGVQLRWIRPAERFVFWKSEVAFHLADGARIDLDSFPDGLAYTASEWAGSADGVPIVLLESHH